jgi:hypothetical protein
MCEMVQLTRASAPTEQQHNMDDTQMLKTLYSNELRNYFKSFSNRGPSGLAVALRVRGRSPHRSGSAATTVFPQPGTAATR